MNKVIALSDGCDKRRERELEVRMLSFVLALLSEERGVSQPVIFFF